jgi:hypothetical protein
MQYVLGNMLNGAGGLNADGLSLNLQFAADKTLTARRGPTPVFTRSSGDNGGTTYFGPLVDFTEATAFSTTGISNGRASWFKSYEGTDITISYTGAQWRIVTVDNGDEVIYLAAPGSEWRPDQADWSGEDISVTTSSTFGIVKAANNEPRFDHTSAGVCRGLLIEESRTNLVTQSGNPASWTGGFTNNGATTAPDGSSNGVVALVGTSAITTPATGAITGLHAASVFVKRNNTDWARVQVAQGSFAHAVNFWVNLATGAAGTLVVAAGTPTSLSAQVTPFGNSWYRVSITASYPATASLTLSVISATADNSITRVSGSVYEVWGGQLEAGSFATSYIPTTTGSLARSADVCSITGANFTSFYNQSEGTLFADVTPQSITQLATVLVVNSGSAQNQQGIYKTNAALTAAGLRWGATSVLTGFATQAAIATGTDVAISRSKLSYAYKLDDFSFAYAGTIVGTDTSGTLPSPTTMQIGNRDGTLQINGHLASIRFYKKRLPNAKLQALTA